MSVTVEFQPSNEPGFPSGYFLAHMPALGLTTHGLGVNGARVAASDLIELWLAESDTNATPEARQKVAPGVSPGLATDRFFSPGGATEPASFAPAGAPDFLELNPGLTPGANFCRLSEPLPRL